MIPLEIGLRLLAGVALVLGNAYFVGETLSDLRGIVYVPALTARREALAAGEVDFVELAAPPVTLAAATTVSDATDRFQAENQELALVLADGEVAGLVTVTDLFESVVGELEDPLDRAGREGVAG